MTNSKLSKNEMKKVLGGVGATSCSTTCKDGSTITSSTCKDGCVATDGVSVICLGGGESKYCPGHEPKPQK